MHRSRVVLSDQSSALVPGVQSARLPSSPGRSTQSDFVILTFFFFVQEGSDPSLTLKVSIPFCFQSSVNKRLELI
jgi:hypothetical protein